MSNGKPKPGGVSFGCPSPITDEDITLEQLCSSLGEIIKWLEDIKMICDALPEGTKTQSFSIPKRGS